MLVDFGVGDYEGSAPLTRSQLPPGTEPYRSPEALRFEQDHRDKREEQYDFTPADDVYALGITWYRALTGEMPFAQQDPQGAWRMRLEKRKPRSPTALNPRVPQAVSNLLLRMLSPRPDKRPTSARLAEELETLTRSGGQELESSLFERRRPRARHALSRAAGLLWRGVRSKPRLSLVSGALLLAALVLLRPLVSPSPPTHPSQESHPMPSLIERILKKTALSACLFTAAGCASGPATGTRHGPPPRPQPCPETALVAMKALNIGPGRQDYVYLDMHLPGGMNLRSNFREGPIVSLYEAADGFNLLPTGTKLHGYLWIVGDKVHAHWDQIVLPDGRELPFCAVLGFDQDGGHWTEPSTEPGTVRLPQQAGMTLTDHFIKPR